MSYQIIELKVALGKLGYAGYAALEAGIWTGETWGCCPSELGLLSAVLSSCLTQDVNKRETNVEIEKIIFSWHVA